MSWKGSWYGIGSVSFGQVFIPTGRPRTKFLAHVDGNVSRTSHPPTLLMTHMYPDPELLSSDTIKITSDQIKARAVWACLYPKADFPVTHTFLMADQVTSTSFVQAVEESSQAVAFIGHSKSVQLLLPDGPTGVVPIGLIMGVSREVQGVFGRVVLTMAPYVVPPPDSSIDSRWAQSGYNSAKIVDEQGPMQPRANVIFLGLVWGLFTNRFSTGSACKTIPNNTYSLFLRMSCSLASFCKYQQALRSRMDIDRAGPG